MSNYRKLPIDLKMLTDILEKTVGREMYEMLANHHVRVKLIHAISDLCREAHKLGYTEGALDITAKLIEGIEDRPRDIPRDIPRDVRVVKIDNPQDLQGLLEHIKNGGDPATFKSKPENEPDPKHWIACGMHTFPRSWAPFIFEPATWVEVIKRSDIEPRCKTPDALESLLVKLSNMPEDEYCTFVGALLVQPPVERSARVVLYELEKTMHGGGTKH